MSYQKDIMYLAFSIPEGVDEITFILSGASGGGGKSHHQGPGGAGGVIIGTMPINASTTATGRTLFAVLGQSGQGVSTGATDGWGAGAHGGEGTGSTGGWGGGSSALVSTFFPADPTSVKPIAAAGGGGGGGSFAPHYPAFGGSGGSGGKPPQDGADGGGEGTWGPGGKGGGSQFEDGTQGGGDDQGFSGTGGGGGGGGAYHGGTGGDSGSAQAAAGGGGGGDSAVDTSKVSSPIFNSGHHGDGQLTIYPGEGDVMECVDSHEPRQMAIPSDVAAFAFVAVGGSGEHGSNEYPHDGTGGVVSGVLDVFGVETLDYWVGCSGYSHNGAGYGRPGAGGDAPSGGNDGGRGGGASAIADHETGTVFVAAGGGGGQGGDSTSCGAVYRDECGGPGGNSAGKPGTRLPASGTDGGGGTNGGSGPGGDGGCANCEGGSHPHRNGGDGVSPDAHFTGAGGGGGAGYPAGGHGGHHSVDEAGGGGGSGGSYFSHSRVSDGSMSPRGTNGDGFILFIPIPVQTTSLTVQKHVTGAGASYATGLFAIDVKCRLRDETVLDASIQLTGGTEYTFQEVRQGSTCILMESGAGGASSPAAPHTVVLGETPVTVTLNNGFALGALELRVFTVVVGEGGGPNPGVTFAVPNVALNVSCTFDGRAIDLPSPATGGQIELSGADTLTPSGAVATIPGLPVGAKCIVARTAGGVSTPEYSVDGGAPTTNPALVTIAPTGSQVHIGDRYLLTPLHIALQADGNGSPPPGAEYQGTVACTIDGASVTLPSDGFTVHVGSSTTVHNLPMGAVCSLENVDPGVAVATTYAPSRTVTMAAGTEITITGTYDDGALLVAVSASGAAASWANVAPTIAVECAVGDTIVLNETFTPASASGGWVAYSPPAGASCTAEQADPLGAASVLYRSSTAPAPSTAPVDVVIPDGAAASLFIEDVFTAAPLRIVADETGAGAHFALPPTTRVSECVFNGLPIDPVAGASSVDLALPGDGGAARLAALPTGASCLVTEPDTGGATTVTATQERGEPSSDVGPGAIRVTVQDGGPTQPTTVVFGNAFDLGALEISMAITGGAAWAATSPYSVDVRCDFAGAPFTALGPDGTATLTFTALGSLVPSPAVDALASLPMGTSCVASETDAAGATTVTYSPAGPGSDSSAPVVVGLGSPAIAITNTFEASGLSVTPTVVGTDAAAYAGHEFWFEAACRFQGAALPAPPTDPNRPAIFALLPGTTATLADLPVGASCSVEQIVDHHATQVAPSRLQTATLTTEPIALSWVNAFDTASVAVSESLSGDGVAAYAADITFAAKVTCTYRDGSDDANLQNGGVVPLSEANGFAGTILAPVGAACDVSQATVPVTRVLLPDSIVVALGSPLALAIESEFWLSNVTVTASATGAVPRNAEFGYSVACSYAGEPVAFAVGGDGPFRLGDGDGRALQTLAGVGCVATQTDAAGATSTTVTVTGQPVATAASARFVAATTPITVAFENAFGWLPHTGLAPTVVVPVAGALMLLGLAALWFSRRRRAAGR